MQFIKDNKMYIIGILLIAGGFWVYMTYFSGGSDSLFTSSEEASPLSQEVLVALSSLHVIKLDRSIFSDPVFTSLTDFGVAIPPQQAGRRNPFAPL
jgi:hypothetical protein